MKTLPFDGNTVFIIRKPNEEIVAWAIGSFNHRDGVRVVLMDTAERHWVVEVDEKGDISAIIGGPVTGGQALHAAEKVVAGISDHGSVSELVNTLALGLVSLCLLHAQEVPA